MKYPFNKKSATSNDGCNKDGSKRWVCQAPKCNVSTHTNKKGEIIKLNNMSFDKTTDLKSLHTCSAPWTDWTELNKEKHWEALKNKPVTQSGSVMTMFEEEQIRLAKEGYDDDYIAHNTYQ